MFDNYKLAHKCTTKPHGVQVTKTISVKLPSWSLCIGIAVYETVLEAYIIKRKNIFIWKHIDMYTFKGKRNGWYSSHNN